LTSRNKILAKVILVVLVSILLLLFSGFSNNADSAFENIYTFIAGEKSPDTNIVIIHISESDLERIGPWPIKRSYYALLIKELTKQNVNKIGLEVFLSSRMVTQTIYDKLLRNEIAKSGKVVLSSVVGKITESKDKFFTDSLSYPSPKLLDNSFLSGHLNYITDAGIKIPLIIDSRGELERAFAYQLYDSGSNETAILINARSSWRSFENYRLIEFFELIRNNAAELKQLKDKTVLIGMSDPIQFKLAENKSLYSIRLVVCSYSSWISIVLSNDAGKAGLYLFIHTRNGPCYHFCFIHWIELSLSIFIFLCAVLFSGNAGFSIFPS
jgi:hypothetical protein